MRIVRHGVVHMVGSSLRHSALIEFTFRSSPWVRCLAIVATWRGDR